MPWWISLILALISNLPEIISIVKDIIALINNNSDPKERRLAFRDLADAIFEYKKTKNPQKLKNLHDKFATVGKPPGLVNEDDAN